MYHDEYLRLGGKKSLEDFRQVVGEFIDWVVPAYVYPEDSEYEREEAFALFTKLVGSVHESNRIFRSVDNIHVLS